MKKIFSLFALSFGFIVSVNAAELPQSATLKYSGSYGIPAEMSFTRSGNNYKIVSTIKVPLYSIRFESGGSIAGNMLKPSYYKDIRRGKLYAEAKFSGNSVSYGKVDNIKTETVSGTTMDLFTLAWQLTASDAKLPAGLQITNGKKLYRVGGISKAGTVDYKLGSTSIPVNRYHVRRGEDTIAYSFAPNLNNILTEINYSDNGKTYNLKLKSVKINGQEVKPQ